MTVRELTGLVEMLRRVRTRQGVRLFLRGSTYPSRYQNIMPLAVSSANNRIADRDRSDRVAWPVGQKSRFPLVL